MDFNRRDVAALLFALMVLLTAIVFVDLAFPQTNMGPVRTPQINTALYVGQSGYATIQSAVTFACKQSSPNFSVVLLPGVNPSDTPTNVTGGCTGTYIADLRGTPLLYYRWAGNGYILTPGFSGLAHTTNLFNGDGAGNAIDSGIAPANVARLNAAVNNFTGTINAAAGEIANSPICTQATGCGGGGGATYPPAGVPISTGAAWEATSINPLLIGMLNQTNNWSNQQQFSAGIGPIFGNPTGWGGNGLYFGWSHGVGGQADFYNQRGTGDTGFNWWDVTPAGVATLMGTLSGSGLTIPAPVTGTANILSNVDLNTLSACGFYDVSNITNGPNGLISPTRAEMIVLCAGTPNVFAQILVDAQQWQTPLALYVRININGWTPWTTISGVWPAGFSAQARTLPAFPTATQLTPRPTPPIPNPTPLALHRQRICNQGEIWVDGNYIYACSATNQPRRSALSAY